MLAKYFVFCFILPQKLDCCADHSTTLNLSWTEFQMIELFMLLHLQTSLANTDFRLILLSKQLNVCAWSDLLLVCKHAIQNYVEDIFKCSILKMFWKWIHNQFVFLMKFYHCFLIFVKILFQLLSTDWDFVDEPTHHFSLLLFLWWLSLLKLSLSLADGC